MQKEYATKDDLLSFAKQVADTLAAYGEATDALRTITMLLAAALARQPALNRELLAKDISALIEANYPPDGQIPLIVLDFRTALVRHLKND